MTINLEDYKEITDPQFSNPGDGIAICHKVQGYGANNWGNKALMLKSLSSDKKVELRKALRQVTVTLSFEEFLRKFFGLWYEDAKILAKILGFEVEEDVESYEDYLEAKVNAVTLIKSLKTEEDFLKLSDEDQDLITDLQKKFEKGLLSGEFTSEGAKTEGDKSSSGVTDTNANSDSKILKGKEMSDKKIEELEKALKESQEALAKANEKIEKSEKAQKEAFNKSLLEKAKGLSILDEKDAEGFVELVKASDVELASKLFELLEKANTKLAEKEDELQKAKEKDPMYSAISKSGNGDEENDTLKGKVSAIIKAKKGEGK